MEFGARALGNRSILANPNSPNKDIINEKIKRRRIPTIAPSILIDHKVIGLIIDQILICHL